MVGWRLFACLPDDGDMSSTFVIETDMDVGARDLFDLSLNIDAHVSSMQRSGERAVAGVTSGMIGLGETVTWRARHFGVWFTLTTRITELEAPARFVDEQVRGPFKVFRHEHLFEPMGDGVRMTDTVTVGSPIFGRLVERGILVPYLRRLVCKRNEHLRAALS